MSAVGICAILLCLAALPLFPPAKSPRGLLLFFALLGLHVAAAVAFYQYALTSSADAALYYYDPTGLRRSELQLGTLFTIKLVQVVKANIGGTYLDFFLLFQVLGFWGLLFLQRCLDFAHRSFGDSLTRTPNWLLFFPGLHFWTSAVGKDAPLFFAISLALWATIRLSTRAIWFGVAVFVMLLFRPHVALLATGALAAGALFSGRSGAIAKVALVAVALGTLTLVAGTVEKSLVVNLTDPSSVGAFLERQQQRSGWIEGATNLQSAIFPIRLGSLLFRPFFVDAGGVFGLISSFENVLYLGVFSFMAWNWREGVLAFRSNLAFRFGFFFAFVLMILLTMTYYNVGLGLRQKTMMMPGLMTFFAVQWIIHRSRVHYRLYGAPFHSDVSPEFALGTQR